MKAKGKRWLTGLLIVGCLCLLSGLALAQSVPVETLPARAWDRYTGNEGDSFLEPIGRRAGNTDVQGGVHSAGLTAWIARWNYTPESSWVWKEYALDGQYTLLSGDIVLLDYVNTTSFSTRFEVYGDGFLLYSVVLTPQALPVRDIMIDTTGVTTLRISLFDEVSNQAGTAFGLSNFRLTPAPGSPEPPAAPDQPPDDQQAYGKAEITEIRPSVTAVLAGEIVRYDIVLRGGNGYFDVHMELRRDGQRVSSGDLHAWDTGFGWGNLQLFDPGVYTLHVTAVSGDGQTCSLEGGPITVSYGKAEITEIRPSATAVQVGDIVRYDIVLRGGNGYFDVHMELRCDGQRVSSGDLHAWDTGFGWGNLQLFEAGVYTLHVTAVSGDGQTCSLEGGPITVSYGKAEITEIRPSATAVLAGEIVRYDIVLRGGNGYFDVHMELRRDGQAVATTDLHAWDTGFGWGNLQLFDPGGYTLHVTAVSGDGQTCSLEGGRITVRGTDYGQLSMSYINVDKKSARPGEQVNWSWEIVNGKPPYAVRTHYTNLTLDVVEWESTGTQAGPQAGQYHHVQNEGEIILRIEVVSSDGQVARFQGGKVQVRSGGGYDVQAAVAFALDNAYAYQDPGKKRYSSDCANFVAFCLEAGGIEMRGTHWDPVSKTNGDIHAWAPSQYRYLAEKYEVIMPASLSDIEVGDVIMYDNDNNKSPDHVTICTDVRNGKPYYCGHSSDARDAVVYVSGRSNSKLMGVIKMSRPK